MNTLSGPAAHNAVTCLIALYGGIIEDYERSNKLLRDQVNALLEQNKQLRNETRGDKEP